MIESKATLIDNFVRLATQYQKIQDPVTGIDLDDACVTLKRYVLSQEGNKELAQHIHELTRLIRSRDMDAYAALLEKINSGLKWP